MRIAAFVTSTIELNGIFVPGNSMDDWRLLFFVLGGVAVGFEA